MGVPGSHCTVGVAASDGATEESTIKWTIKMGRGTDKRPFISDQGWLKVMEYCPHEEVDKEERYVRQFFDDLIPRTFSSGNISNHAELCGHLANCHALVEKELSKWASYYTTLQWLWYLRRLPSYVFEGKLASTIGYDSQLAETFTGMYGRQAPATNRQGNVLHFEINRSIIRRVLRLAHGTRYLSRLHGSYRMTGKGQRYEISGKHHLPEFLDSGQLQDAITLYDERSAKSNLFGRTGTAITTPLDSGSDDEILLVHRLTEATLMPSFWQDSERVKHDITVLARFVATFNSLSGLRTLNSRLSDGMHQVWSQQVLAVFYLLRFAIYLMLYGTSSFSKVLEYGYVVTDADSHRTASDHAHDWVMHFMKEVFPTAPVFSSAQEVVSIVESMTGRVWPLQAGTLLRFDKGFMCIDLHAASMLLHSILEYPKTDGAIANARGFHFEEMVQERIDLTPWKPPIELQKTRGRELRLGGQVLTDIDALAAQNDTLLLISCKSIVYSAEYDRGDYSVVRNVSETIVNAVSKWKGKIDTLRRFKKGDNYDFTGFTDITGVVCTPYAPYVPIGPSTEMVLPELRAACSVEELIEWLELNNRPFIK